MYQHKVTKINRFNCDQKIKTSVSDTVLLALCANCRIFCLSDCFSAAVPSGAIGLNGYCNSGDARMALQELRYRKTVIY